MSPSPNSNPGAAPLPPLPNLSSGGGQGAAPGQDQSGMAAIISGLTPVKSAVDAIQMACKQIVQSGMLPGSEQVCGQIIALSTSLLTQAATTAAQGMGGGQQQGPTGLPPVGGGQ